MISFEDALQQVLLNTQTMGTEQLPLDSLSKRVLARSVRAPIDLPIFSNSAVDGYAVRSADTGDGGSLRLVGRVIAGDGDAGCIKSGETMRVFTGSAIPDGADAVVMQEDVSVSGQTVQVRRIERGACIRCAGEEVKQGEQVLEAGTYIDPPTLGVLSTLGIAHAEVYKKPRVAIIGTGNEVVPPGEHLGPGQIYESNTRAISYAARSLGAGVVRAVTVQDSKEAIKRELECALEISDVVLTCGGISVGEHDFVKDCATNLGVKEIFWRIAMRPGKPVFFGRGLSGQLFFGLPGNPVSALVTFYLLVKPALKKMVAVNEHEPIIRGTLASPIDKVKGRAEFLRARAIGDAEWTLMPLETQGSHMSTGLCGGYLIYGEADREHYDKGDLVKAYKLNWGLP